ncbi:ABC transporter ATP-binding protein [Bifidobacterium sp.]|jgi:ABC-2 type transport system ATP-binding protein|uniref:ABC transporter ATP-binding protein n=1 Tax=Bifidobacterium sp. TaxID=41200 RepID=UPI0025C4F58D|nr:ABC transporter ATP-binding protein [Bifidobacterium sp.]MCI1635581.1 ABC transporter ATP-binding protein [Bifidobacterium sp.]
MSAQTITVNHLTRDYGPNKGVFDLSFDIAAGEAFGFLGPNGSGKTTTIRHLMGFLKPNSGTCTILGRDCWKERDTIQARAAYIPGEIALFNDMTGNSYLDFIQRYRHIHGSRRRRELTELFELDASGPIRRMSKGTKQKIAIVAALMSRPEVLILDEATSGLDPLMRNRFISLIDEEKRGGATILMSSHMFEEVERTCDRVGIINQGRLLATDSIDALKAQQTRRYVLAFADETSTQRFLQEDFVCKVLHPQHIEVTISGNLSEFLVALSRYPITNLFTPAQSLEEVFMHYYRDGDQS